MKDPFNLKGRLAVVTGGLGRLGREFSVSLAGRGCRVAVLDKNVKTPSFLETFASAVKKGRIRVFHADVTARASLERTLRKIQKAWAATPDILINNAAVDTPPSANGSHNGPFEDYPENLLSEMIDVNLKGVFFCCQVFGREMARIGRGSIVNIASTYGMVSPDQSIYAYKRRNGASWYKPAPYAMTKSGIYNLTRYLATYWAPRGVRVNALTPAGVFDHQDDEFLEAYVKKVPLGRMAHPHEMNGAVIFLASDASSYMTGSNLVVDGGYTAW